MNSQEREVFWQTLCSIKDNGEQDVQKLKQTIKLPKYLFRYRPVSMNSLEALRTNKLYFSSANYYDDPFDTFLHIDLETIKKEYIRTYYTTYYQLCKTYPEQYFHMTIGELDIAVLELASGSVCAFFEDSTYIYQVYFSYSVVER